MLHAIYRYSGYDRGRIQGFGTGGSFLTGSEGRESLSCVQWQNTRKTSGDFVPEKLVIFYILHEQKNVLST